jgi:hypothetical protein
MEQDANARSGDREKGNGEVCYICGRTPEDMPSIFGKDSEVLRAYSDVAADFITEYIQYLTKQIGLLEEFQRGLTKEITWESVERNKGSTKDYIPGLHKVWKTLDLTAKRSRVYGKTVLDVAREARESFAEHLAEAERRLEAVNRAGKLPIRFQQHRLGISAPVFEVSEKPQPFDQLDESPERSFFRLDREVKERTFKLQASVYLCPVCSSLLSQAAGGTLGIVRSREDLRPPPPPAVKE